MANKLPWLQLFIADYLHDTAALSPASRGIWMDALLAMHAQDQCGELRGTFEQLSRVLRCTPNECEACLTELDVLRVADVSRDCNGFSNAIVTVINRRMKRAFNERVSSKLRKQKQRGDGECHGDVTAAVTDKSAKCHAPYSQSQSQKEREGEKTRAKKPEPEPPVFEPVERGLYRREYDAMLADADAAIKAVNRNESNYVRDMADSVVEVVAFLRDRSEPGWEARVKALVDDPNSYVRAGLKPKPAAVVAAWRARRSEIEAAMKGIKG